MQGMSTGLYTCSKTVSRLPSMWAMTLAVAAPVWHGLCLPVVGSAIGYCMQPSMDHGAWGLSAPGLDARGAALRCDGLSFSPRPPSVSAERRMWDLFVRRTENEWYEICLWVLLVSSMVWAVFWTCFNSLQYTTQKNSCCEQAGSVILCLSN